VSSWIKPLEGKITDSFQGHKNRAKPSVNPGTDYAVAIGTPVAAIADGLVSGVVPTIKGAGGRMVFLSFPSGHNADYLHLSRIDVTTAQEVKKGQIIGLSGASGLGKERGYGPHLHLSFRLGGRPTTGTGNIDYEAFLVEQGVAPAVAKPVAAKPAVAKPAVAKPVAAKPAVAKPAVAKPVAAKPAAIGTYTVKSGDNLTKIAQANNTTVAKLVELNKIKNANLISVGQVLKLG
jgi:murein DD-endopeptidase MepM/ murein hydrolase activator NlpD